MSKFVIQCEEICGQLIPAHDFGFELIQAIKFQEWYRQEQRHEVAFVKDVELMYRDYIPVGSVEFVQKFMEEFWDVRIVKPLNIPEELYPFANRFVQRLSKKDIDSLFEKYNQLFIKSDDKIKDFSEFCNKKSEIPEGNYIVSELIDIRSEYRCFIKDGRLLDIKNYSGEIDILPNFNTIENMIKAYKSAPPAYTLDVAITGKGETVVIECHNFFSCGLYGFSDYNNLTGMLSQAYYWQLKN